MSDFSEVTWVPPTGLGEENGHPTVAVGICHYSAREHLAECQARCMRSLSLCIFSSGLTLLPGLYGGGTPRKQSMCELAKEGRSPWTGGRPPAKFNTLTLLGGIFVILQMGGEAGRHLTCFTHYSHEGCQTASQVLEENPHYSSHKSAYTPPGGEMASHRAQSQEMRHPLCD